CTGILQMMQASNPHAHTLVSTGANPSGDHTLQVDVSAELARPPAHGPGFAFLTPPERADEIGRLADYRVLKKLRAGGMGMVFLAEEAGLERPVALKVMLPEAAATQGAGERFLREAKLTASIRNDHIVTIYRVSRQGDVPFLAMELLHGS